MDYLQITMEGIFIFCCGMHCYTDFKEQLLYDEINMLLLLAGAVLHYQSGDFVTPLYGAVVTGSVFLLLFFLSRGGMGFGDVKLAAVMGFWLGWEQGLFALLLALCAGSAAGLALLALKLKSGKEAIPFGPYICLGGLVMLYYGDYVLSMYLNLF